jgi:RecA/RadA recombinase
MGYPNMSSTPVVNSSGIIVDLTPQRLLSLGVLWPAEVDRICDGEKSTQFLVEGFLPAKSIAIAAGESTIGKSSLSCQLALCVAAGIPFLGMKTQEGRVLYLDLENSLPDCKAMRDALVGFLGLNETPKDFLLVTEPKDLKQLIEAVSPSLVVIDSLRAFRPDAAAKNENAAQLLRSLRSLARKYGCTFLLIHHMRKPPVRRDANEHQVVAGLEYQSVSDWLLDMEGARALVNQTDVRIAVEEGNLDPAALRVKWSLRVHGDSPLFSLERVFDDGGEPIGYRHLTGADFLIPDHRAALERLPRDREFSFTEAMRALDRTQDPTNKFLKACIDLRLIEKVCRGRYRRVKTEGGQK